MKIVSITMIKNESDIIESFIRYHANIFDEMIVLDNGSSDESKQIIENLQSENLPVTLIEDDDAYYNQNEKLTRLMKKAFEEFSADLLCPLDVDEFLCCDTKNPREILENLDESSYYLIKWETYVATAKDDPAIKFIPERITHMRDEKLDSFYKIAVPKDIAVNCEISLQVGSHDLIFENPQEIITPQIIDDLKIAHFPLRSVEQCMSKILVGWPNMISKNVENSDLGFHWKKLFDIIKENGKLTQEDLELFSRNYALEEFRQNIEIMERPMNIDFCKNIDIKYDYDYNYLRNVLENYVYYVEKVVSSKMDRFDENSSWKFITPQINPEYINFDSKDTPKVSVVIPAYNAEKYLKECLDSVINQTFKDIEVICVNDGSTDSTLEIMKSYSSQDNRVKVISHENIGAGPARNNGFEAAKGKYIYTLDADDYIYDDAIEDMYNNAVLNNSDIVLIKYGRDEITDRLNSKNGFYFDDILNRRGDEYDEFTFTYKDIKSNVLNTYFNHWLGFYKREFLDKWDELYFEKGQYEDVLFHVKALLRAERISHIPKIYYYYRRAENSQMSNYKGFIEIFDVIDSVENYLTENGFLDEFKDELDLFMIVQALTYILCNNSEEYFQLTKERFSRIELSPNHIVEPHRVNLYKFVLESNNYAEYLKSYYSYMLRNSKAENHNLQLENIELKNKNKNLNSENMSLKEQNNALLNSNSWKMTKPLRKLKQMRK